MRIASRRKAVAVVRQVGLPVVKIYRGLPVDVDPVTEPSTLSSSARLEWRFLLAFLLLILLFIIILLAVVCVRQRRRQKPTPIEEDVSTCWRQRRTQRFIFRA